MSEWIGVVQHDVISGKRIGESLINLDNVAFIGVTEDTVNFLDGKFIKINKESTKMLLDVIKTI